MATKTATKNDVTISHSTVEDLASRYCQVQCTVEKLDAVKKWEWARDVSMLLASTADKSARTTASEKLGELIGLGLNRKPYSGSWVRQHCSAYGKFKGGLTSQEDYRGFLLAVNGNAGPSKTEPKEKTEKSASDTDSDGEVENDYLGKITAAVKRAIKAGISLSDINEAVLRGQE